MTTASGEVIVGSEKYPVGSHIGNTTLFGNRKNNYDIERLNNVKEHVIEIKRYDNDPLVTCNIEDTHKLFDEMYQNTKNILLCMSYRYS